MKTATFSQPWVSTTVSMTTPRGGSTYVVASSAEVDAHVQSLLQEQAQKAGAEPDSSLGSYVTSVLRETDGQLPVTELAEYESLRELIQEQCWLDSSDQADALIHQIAAIVRTQQIMDTATATQTSAPVLSPHTETNLIPGDLLWGQDEVESASSVPHVALSSATTKAQLPLQHEAEFSSNYTSYPTPGDYEAEQAFESSVEILLSMNPDISEEAARRALELVQGDVNWGQYLVDLALSAPPVCRHLLRDGCYRRDCQFSHDIDGHTCVFWMRGRCGKGDACQFRHGFDEKAVEDALASSVGVNDTSETKHVVASEVDPPLPTAGLSAEAKKQESIWGRTSSTSFAQIASQGGPPSTAFPSLSSSLSKKMQPLASQNKRRVDIPQDLWHAHENRDSAVFYISDPLERYHAVAASVQRKNVVDLHFQSTKTFATVLEAVLPEKLAGHPGGVWIVTGTGHHVGSKTHQKGGGALENAVIKWLAEAGYDFSRGRDRNGLGGAVLVKR